MSIVFSVDAETNGLYGETLAIAVTVREGGEEITQWSGRRSTPDKLEPWVAQNVMPAIAGMPIEYRTSAALEEAFWAFWTRWKKSAIVVAHCANPVETGLFLRCVGRDPQTRQWDGPYPAIDDVATLLRLLGEDPASVDAYIRHHGLTVPYDGASHHPMYDAVAAAVVYEHAAARLRASHVE